MLHSSPSPGPLPSADSDLGGYISFHNNIKKAAIATSCDPQSETSLARGKESIEFEVEVEEEEGEGKLVSKTFYRLASPRDRYDIATYLPYMSFNIFNFRTSRFWCSRI